MKIIISLLILAVLYLQGDENTQQNLNLKETDDKVLVIDSFMWQDEPYTYFERQARYDGKNYEKARTWESAIGYCEKLSLAGYSDWRLPSRSELATIVDKSRKPAIKKEFKNFLATFYWSSTPHDRNNEEAWFIRYNNGIASHTYKSRSHFVRCIRDIQ